MQEAVEEISGGHVVLTELQEPSPRLVLVVPLHLVHGAHQREGGGGTGDTTKRHEVTNEGHLHRQSTIITSSPSQILSHLANRDTNNMKWDTGLPQIPIPPCCILTYRVGVRWYIYV